MPAFRRRDRRDPLLVHTPTRIFIVVKRAPITQDPCHVSPPKRGWFFPELPDAVSRRTATQIFDPLSASFGE
ncbi:hypothetical protein, partial [Ralstonia sp. 1B3]|uniref:hypothetical protein n=1 Tax=Ralstonia sp. 1B3 TaxID=2997421 RepID=UPI002FCBDADB